MKIEQINRKIFVTLPKKPLLHSCEIFDSKKGNCLTKTLEGLSSNNISTIKPKTLEKIIEQMEYIPQIETQEYFLDKINNCEEFYKTISRESPNFVNQMLGKNKLLRKTQLFDRRTEKREDAFIFKSLITNNITIHTKKENLGCITLNNALDKFVQGKKLDRMSQSYKNNDFLEVRALKTANLGSDKSPYKGIGTELLKQAIIESNKLGHKGRIALVAENYDDITGKDAHCFYEHLGFTKNHFGMIFALDEEKIADFLLK